MICNENERRYGEGRGSLPIREDEIFHRAHRRGRRQRQRSCARRRSEGGVGWARGGRLATRARRKEERGGGGGEAQTRGVGNRSATTTRMRARRSRSRDARTSTSSSSRERASERRGRWIARSRDRRGGKRARTDVDALHHPKPHFHRRHGVRAVASDSDAMPRRLCDLLFRGTTRRQPPSALDETNARRGSRAVSRPHRTRATTPRPQRPSRGGDDDDSAATARERGSDRPKRGRARGVVDTL